MRYRVDINISGFTSIVVEAENEDEAMDKARHAVLDEEIIPPTRIACDAAPCIRQDLPPDLF